MMTDFFCGVVVGMYFGAGVGMYFGAGLLTWWLKWMDLRTLHRCTTGKRGSRRGS